MIIMLVWMQIRRVDLDCLGVVREVERRRLQAAVRELGLHGATQVAIISSQIIASLILNGQTWLLIYKCTHFFPQIILWIDSSAQTLSAFRQLYQL